MQTKPKPFVFVLMPFNKDFDDTYQLAIKEACEHAGAYAERVDEQIFQGSILERIYNQISKSDIVIADLSGRNPNVFYETGYAHALGKLTLLLTNDANDIPFDLKHYPHIVYEQGLKYLRTELEKRIRWHLDNPEKKQLNESILGIRVNSVFINDAPTIDIPIDTQHIGLEMRVDLHNMIRTEIKPIYCQIGLFSDKLFVSSTCENSKNNVVSFPEKTNLHLPSQSVSLLPAGWDTLNFLLLTNNEPLNPGKQYEFTFRVFSESGYFDMPFTVQLTKKQNGAG